MVVDGAGEYKGGWASPMRKMAASEWATKQEDGVQRGALLKE